MHPTLIRIRNRIAERKTDVDPNECIKRILNSLINRWINDPHETEVKKLKAINDMHQKLQSSVNDNLKILVEGN